MSWSDELPKAASAGSGEIIPLPSDAPAETIARLSVELAASKAQVARMRLVLARLAELAALWKEQKPSDMIGFGGATLALSSLLTGTVLPAPGHIAIPRERYDRMVKALGMGEELNYCARRADDADDRDASDRCDSILAAMDAAGKA